MKQLLTIIAIIAFATGCSIQSGKLTANKMVEDATELVKTTKPANLMKIMETEEVFTVIDVRQRDEHYYGYIPGAVNIPRGSIEFNIDSEKYWEDEGLYMPAKNELIILYCKKGKRSILAGKTLQDMGYNKVLVLDGGWKNWELNYPDYCDKNLDMLAGGTENHDDGGGC